MTYVDKGFKALGNDYRLAYKWKISEVLFIKQLKSSLKVKEISIYITSLSLSFNLRRNGSEIINFMKMKLYLLLLACKNTAVI